MTLEDKIDDKIENQIKERKKPVQDSLEAKVQSNETGFFAGMKKAGAYLGTLGLAVYTSGSFPLLMTIGMSAGEIFRLRKAKEKFSMKKLKPVAYAGIACGTFVKYYFENFVSVLGSSAVYEKLARGFRVALLVPMFNMTAQFTNYVVSKYSPVKFVKKVSSSGLGFLSEFYNERLKGKYLSTLKKAYTYIFPAIAANSMFHLVKPEYLLPVMSGFFRYKVHGASQSKNKKNEAGYERKENYLPSAVPKMAYA